VAHTDICHQSWGHTTKPTHDPLQSQVSRNCMLRWAQLSFYAYQLALLCAHRIMPTLWSKLWELWHAAWRLQKPDKSTFASGKYTVVSGKADQTLGIMLVGRGRG
jgi:hypothetical protein